MLSKVVHGKKAVYAALLVSCSVVLTACVQQPNAEQKSPTQPPNIIYMIGDGMGFEYISAYRYAKSKIGMRNDEEGGGTLGLAPTAFDEMLTGAATTYPDDDTWVTDSAAGATALATGVKSYNGAIGVNAQQYPLTSIMSLARDKGWGTGAIATVQVNHATPASFFTHHPSRRMYNAIADTLAAKRTDGQWRFDVLLGGGYDYFVRDDVNHLANLRAQGMQVITEFDELETLDQAPALGVFAPKALPYVIDDQPRLPDMTRTALRLLTDQQKREGKPFILMVEASKIDWCGHDNDIACAMHEMSEFDAAIEVARAYQKEHPNTLIVITADHSTGGLTLGQGGEYAWYSDRVMRIRHSVRHMAGQLLEKSRDQWRPYLAAEMNLPLSAQQWQQIIETDIASTLPKDDQEEALALLLTEVISEVTRTGWTTDGHTAVDVPILAAGPHADKFNGYMDNTEIAQQLIKLLGDASR